MLPRRSGMHNKGEEREHLLKIIMMVWFCLILWYRILYDTVKNISFLYLKFVRNLNISNCCPIYNIYIYIYIYISSKSKCMNLWHMWPEEINSMLQAVTFRCDGMRLFPLKLTSFVPSCGVDERLFASRLLPHLTFDKPEFEGGNNHQPNTRSSSVNLKNSACNCQGIRQIDSSRRSGRPL